MIRRTATAIAIALLWAPAVQGFVPGTLSQGVANKVSASFVVVRTAVSDPDNNNNDIDMEALDKKNAYRKKYGLSSLTPEEFLENEAKVQQLASQQEQKAAELQKQRAASTAEMTQQHRQKTLVPGFLEKIFGSDTCESNFDCESPQVCCDFGFTRKCCSSGMRQRSLQGDYAFVPVPVDIQPPSQY